MPLAFQPSAQSSSKGCAWSGVWVALAALFFFGQAEPLLASSTGPAASGSVSQLAQGLNDLGLDVPSLVVFGSILDVDQRLTDDRRAELQADLMQQLGSAVPLATTYHPQALSLAAARLRARRSNVALVFIELALHSSKLELRARVFRFPRSFWQKARAPKGTLTSDRRFAAPLDASLRQYFPRRLPLSWKPHQVANPVAATVALACGDIDLDGKNEVLIVGRSSVVLGQVGKTQFLALQKSSPAKWGPVAGAPLRAPLASAHIAEGRALIGLSDRQQLFVVDEKLELVETRPRGYPLSASSCAPFTELGLGEPSSDCQRASDLKQANHYDALLVGQYLERSGGSARLEVRLPVGSTTAEISLESTSLGVLEHKLEGAGAALAAADLDGDGSIELITSTANAGAADGVVAHFLGARGLSRMIETAGAPVHALTVCPFTGTNPLSVLVAAGQHLWVLSQ